MACLGDETSFLVLLSNEQVCSVHWMPGISCCPSVAQCVTSCTSSFSHVCLTFVLVLYFSVICSLDLNMELPQGQTGSVGTSVASAEQVS